ncbi:MAG: hypothetical protein K2G15_09775, partial [Muribaculaceae bacterium]|nr:hypothetical protein [Muribaculaceae bacterium]
YFMYSLLHSNCKDKTPRGQKHDSSLINFLNIPQISPRFHYLIPFLITYVSWDRRINCLKECLSQLFFVTLQYPMEEKYHLEKKSVELSFSAKRTANSTST